MAHPGPCAVAFLEIPKALLCAWFNIGRTDQPNFYEWHDREHMPERLNVPGFRRGRRFKAPDKNDLFLIIYEVDSLQVFDSDAYLARRQNPTDWSKSTRGVFANEQRVYVQSTLACAVGAGGFVFTLQLTATNAFDVAEVMNSRIAWIAEQP